MAQHLNEQDYTEVTQRYAGHIRSALGEKFLGLTAKWQKQDIVAGMSDLDYRVILKASAGVDDWIAVDRACGEIHGQLARHCRRWWRILEHTPGCGLTTEQVTDERWYHPEYRFWQVVDGRSDLLEPMNAHLAGKSWEIRDELYHLKRFLYFYSPYQQGIDPPVNVGESSAAYNLHSRCWHYFAPAMLSVAALLAGRAFDGKSTVLAWLIRQFPKETTFTEVSDMVAAGYQVPQLTDRGCRDEFDARMYAVFKMVEEPIRESLRLLSWPANLGVAAMKQQMAGDTSAAGARMMLADAVRFARIRLGRYLFYLDPPPGFDAVHPLRSEAMWCGVVFRVPLELGATVLGMDIDDPKQVMAKILGRTLTVTEGEALDGMQRSVAVKMTTHEQARKVFSDIAGHWLSYYRLFEEYADALDAQLEKRSRA